MISANFASIHVSIFTSSIYTSETCYNILMNNSSIHVEKEPEKIHQEQKTWHILLPVCFTVVICLAFFVWLIVSSSQMQSTLQWAQISTILLVTPLLLIGIMVLAVIVFLISKFHDWNRKLPPILRTGRTKIVKINQETELLIQQPAKPVIRINSFFAGLASLFTKKA
jgi:hypothetical protein